MILRRDYENQHGTFGTLLADDKTPLGVYTLELPWKDDKPDVSCIPPGTYKCISHSGEHWQDVWEVTGVPGRSAILIHAGNTIKDTLGCILVGLEQDEKGVVSSRDALAWLRTHQPDEFELTVLATPA